MDTTIFLSTPLLIFFFWIFLIMIGEEKEDWVYKILQLPIGLTFGVTLLEVNMYLGLGVIFTSIYVLSIAYWQGRDKRKEE